MEIFSKEFFNVALLCILIISVGNVDTVSVPQYLDPDVVPTQSSYVGNQEEQGLSNLGQLWRYTPSTYVPPKFLASYYIPSFYIPESYTPSKYISSKYTPPPPAPPTNLGKYEHSPAPPPQPSNPVKYDQTPPPPPPPSNPVKYEHPPASPPPQKVYLTDEKTHKNSPAPPSSAYHAPPAPVPSPSSPPPPATTTTPKPSYHISDQASPSTNYSPEPSGSSYSSGHKRKHHKPKNNNYLNPLNRAGVTDNVPPFVQPTSNQQLKEMVGYNANAFHGMMGGIATGAMKPLAGLFSGY